MSKRETEDESAKPTDQSVNDQVIASIIMEETDSDEETPQSYNKLKYHSSKMDLNLRILRDEMANLQDSGNSLSRQFASMYRTFQEMKDENDEDDDEEKDECFDYDQYSDDDLDSQCADGKDDGLDTEDDVNRMSDLETDYSSRSTASKRKKQQKRPPPLQLDSQENSFGKDSNGNEMKSYSPLPEHIDDADQAQNSDFYPDFDTSSSEDCSHCLCCSSLASYSSGVPWKYVDKSASAQEYDSDSSDNYSDMDDGPEAASMPIHKRLSPFFYQDCYAEVEEGIPLSDEEVDRQKGGLDRDGDESVPETRMSPLGCESPKPATSRGNSQTDIDKDFKENQEQIDNKAVESNTSADAPCKNIDKDIQIKESNSTTNKLKSTQSPGRKKATEVEKSITNGTKDEIPENVTQTPSHTSTSKEAEESAVLKSKAITKTTDNELNPSVDDESDIVINIKDRIKNFEAQSKENTTNPCKRIKRSNLKQANVTDVNPLPAATQQSLIDNKNEQMIPNTKSNASNGSKGNDIYEALHVVKDDANDRDKTNRVKAKPPPVKSKPQKSSLAPANQGDCLGQLAEKRKDSTPRHVSKSTFRVKTPESEQKEISGNQESRRRVHSSSTIEIPVQFLSTKDVTSTNEGVFDNQGESTLTFQVRPIASDTRGPPKGPLIITSSPQPKRKMTKKVVQLSPCDDDVSEQLTLRPEPQGGARPNLPVEDTERQHPICPHCHKKAVPSEERKRNFQVLQLKPVSDTELPPTPTTPTPQTSITFEAPQPQQVPPARIIKVIPAGRQFLMQRQPSKEQSRVHLRLNMGGPQGVPIKIGDYIRIPLNPGQARGVRVIFN